MVRLSVLAIFAAAISTAAAQSPTGQTCQCLYADGSHCCVNFGTEDCQTQCRTSGKDSGKCNADGKWSSVSWFTGLGRTKCTN
ncbi:uncharacterized protein FIESC28_11131 [Fusarium coffeatum]|uniref:Extracellular membrane protein CFEM domain-containing protein n=1 Tax=Fusarium coffeatum TaxID=231269 RepID=A0A366QMT8_9HYPO|nr:uncharacterized protein FIESC28_11131 [Fusarium coffeatum]RBR06244.1 hypothetical protein FIESC28_11131 [Fusarium coffeatum]